MVAVAEKLSMSVEEGGSLFFQPTALGSCSERMLRVKNLSRVPVEFKWRLCGSDQRVLSVLPDTDILQPNESKVRLQRECGVFGHSSFTLIDESICLFSGTEVVLCPRGGDDVQHEAKSHVLACPNTTMQEVPPYH